MTEVASNFMSGALGSAWYTSRNRMCRTTGFSLLANLGQNLRDTLARTGAQPTSGNTTISANQIVPLDLSGGEGWTTNLLRGLYAVAPAVFKPAIQNDLQIGRLSPGRTLSTRTMQTAIWFAFESGVEGTQDDLPLTLWGHAGSPADIDFGANPVLPTFGSTPEVPADHVVGDSVCVTGTSGPGAQGPTHVQATQGVSMGLILAGLAFTVVAATVLTQGSPTRKQLRDYERARRNPEVSTALESMSLPERRYAVAHLSKAQLISLLKWRHPRGVYTDDERIRAGMFPLTHASAAQLALKVAS